MTSTTHAPSPSATLPSHSSPSTPHHPHHQRLPHLPPSPSHPSSSTPTPPHSNPSSLPLLTSPHPTPTSTTNNNNNNTPAQNPPSHKPRPRSHSHSDAVLPRGSVVQITGNNRTKWDLIGRSGVVRAAQTLGGWHEVQLNDGAVVRVQRNALEVVERAAPDPTSVVRIDARKEPVNLLERPLLGAVKKKKKKREGFVGGTFANIAKLNVASLKRYRMAYNLQVDSDCSKDELVGAVKSHFEKTTVNETEVISRFLNFLRHIASGGPAASD